MVLLDQETRLLTGSADSELRAWDITYLQEVSSNMKLMAECCFKHSVFPLSFCLVASCSGES